MVKEVSFPFNFIWQSIFNECCRRSKSEIERRYFSSLPIFHTHQHQSSCLPNFLLSLPLPNHLFFPHSVSKHFRRKITAHSFFQFFNRHAPASRCGRKYWLRGVEFILKDGMQFVISSGNEEKNLRKHLPWRQMPQSSAITHTTHTHMHTCYKNIYTRTNTQNITCIMTMHRPQISTCSRCRCVVIVCTFREWQAKYGN